MIHPSKLTDDIVICHAAWDWLEGYNDLELAYQECKNPRWLLYILERCYTRAYGTNNIYYFAKQIGYPDFANQWQPVTEDVDACNKIREKYPYKVAEKVFKARLLLNGVRL